jgi:hypothetical protein
LLIDEIRLSRACRVSDLNSPGSHNGSCFVFDFLSTKRENLDMIL